MRRKIVIVGAGPAGMAAAIEAEARGCTVTLIDEAARPGGQIYRQASPALEVKEFADPAERNRKYQLLERFSHAVRQIDYRAGASAYAAFPNGELHVEVKGRTEVLRPDAIVLATGVREVAIPFPGWTTPGVMYAGGAQAILKSQQVLPGRRVVIAGCGPLPIVVAAQIIRAGGTVAALANLHAPTAMLRFPAGLWYGRAILGEGVRYAWTVLRAGVKRLTGYVPVRAIGRERLEAVVLAKAATDGRIVQGSEREIACDALAINYGFIANSELAAMAGVQMRRDPISGWVPVVDELGRTSTPRILVAGDGGGLRGALVAEAEGAIAGAAAASLDGTPAAAIGKELADAFNRRRQQLEFQRAVRTLLHVPLPLWSTVTDETIVCRCENVRFAEIRSAFRGGHRSPNAVKRNTRIGMGVCGGRTCMHALAALTELGTGEAPASMMTPRPLARPVAFSAIAQQRKTTAP